jgi:hypothetical protein
MVGLVEGEGVGPSEGVCIPMILPLVGPLQFPAEIIGHVSLGMEGINILSQAASAATEAASDPGRLAHPMVRAWFAAAAAQYAPKLAVEVMSKQSIVSSLTCKDPTDPPESTVSFANPLMMDFWRVMEATLAFRYQLDALFGHPKASKTASSFYKCCTMNTTYWELYHKHNILGQRPFEMGFKVLLLRLPVAVGKRGTPTFRDLMPFWNLEANHCPTFLRDYKVEFVNFTEAIERTRRGCQ